MFVKNETTLRVIYAFCAAQFSGFFFYFQINAHPLTRQNMLTIAISLAFGLVFAGTARRDYQTFVEAQKKMKELKKTEQEYKNILGKEFNGK